MRLLADENIPGDTIRALRAAGHDVFAAAEAAPGAADQVLLDRARSEARVVLTFDRDFGELAVREPSEAPTGVVLLRFTPPDAAAVTRVVLELLTRSDLTIEAFLSVVEARHIRQRPLRAV
jgi:predicted nuclease of predicted toxin-antitoxin system